MSIPDRWTPRQLPRRADTGDDLPADANGLVLCGGAALLTIVCATLAGYALSRFNIEVQAARSCSPILFSTGLPITAIMVPVYGLFVQLNLIDTLPGTMLFMADDRAAVRDLADEELHGQRAAQPGGGGLDRRRLADADALVRSSCR